MKIKIKRNKEIEYIIAMIRILIKIMITKEKTKIIIKNILKGIALIVRKMDTNLITVFLIQKVKIFRNITTIIIIKNLWKITIIYKITRQRITKIEMDELIVLNVVNLVINSMIVHNLI